MYRAPNRTRLQRLEGLARRLLEDEQRFIKPRYRHGSRVVRNAHPESPGCICGWCLLARLLDEPEVTA